MKDKKWVIVISFILLITIYYLVSAYTDFLVIYPIVNYLLFGFTVVTAFVIIVVYFARGNFTMKDKLFNSIVKNLDTVYLLIDSNTNEVVYVSETASDILGLNSDNNDISYQILNIPAVKNELNSWNKSDNYVGNMIEYDAPKYNHQMWIRIKIFPYVEKEEKYYIIEITDATKEHDRQHLLISQANNIKTRENALNQITERSYDFEINVNVAQNTCDLKYYKKDNLYFGDERRGTYTDELNNILEYINEADRDLVYSNLNIDNLKEHFNKYEFDSITFRYKLGNEIKNNVWLESTVFFITDRYKNIVSILTKNVTESAETIREQNIVLQNALNEAKQISKSKSELISAISHDIRIPLTNIVGLSDSLLDENLNNEIKDDIKNINDSSKDLVEIIDGLLDTSKIEKKLVEKDEKNYSIFKMFKTIEKNAKEYIDNKNISFKLNLDKNLPVVLYGDESRIIKAINEIVYNAVKHTNEGIVTITVKGEKIDNNVKLIIDVEDTGEGISKEKLSTIFTDKSNKGIQSVKQFVNLLGGELEIESKEDKYTKVTISCIQKIVADNKVREKMKSNKEAKEFSLTGKKVLVVDDNALNLKVTERLLKHYDVEVILLESGEECIDYIKNQNYVDLILMDQMMPGLDGTTTLEKLNKIDGFKIPVVVLTADAMQGQREKYLDSGFADYISKPIDKSELSRVLEKYIKDQN